MEMARRRCPAAACTGGRHVELGLGEVLDVMRRRRRLADVEVDDVDRWKVCANPALARANCGSDATAGRSASDVAPTVEVGNRRARAALLVELHRGHSQADEARKERLVELRVLCERHALHHRRQLVVVANKNDALEPRAVCGRVLLLQHHRDEGLHLHDLCRLLDHQRVVLEAERKHIAPFDGRVCACHRNHLMRARRARRRKEGVRGGEGERREAQCGGLAAHLGMLCEKEAAAIVARP